MLSVSPVSSASVVRCFLGQQPRRIKSHHNPSIAYCSLALLCPFSRCIRPRLSPHSLRENQLHQLDKGHAYTAPAVYPGAQTETRPSPAGQRTAIISREAGSQQPSPSSQKAAQARQGTSSCHLTAKSLAHLVSSAIRRRDSLSLEGLRKNPEQRLRHGRPSQARSPPQAGPNPSNILILGSGKEGSEIFDRSPSRSASALPLNPAPGAYSNTHPACRTLSCCNSTCCM